MKKYIITSIIIAMTFVSSFADTSKGKVAIVFNGKTRINNHAIEFVNEQFENAGYSTVEISVTSAVNSDDYKAILLLNSGLSAGIDQTLANFIAQSPNKEKLFVANLYSNKSDLTVVRQTSDESDLKVDGITAATTWQDKGFLTLFGGKNPPAYDMHLNWTKQIIDYLNNLK